MPKMERTVIVNAPAQKIFDYTREPTSQPEWLPSMMEVNDVSGHGEAGTHFRWTYKMAGLRLKGRSEVIEVVGNERHVTRTTGGAVSTWTSTMTPQGDGTRWTLAVEYAVPIPVLGRIAETLLAKQNERDLEQAMANVKAKMER